MISQDNTRELATNRLIRATPEQVFKAWSDPTILARWWGPDGFTNTIHRLNFHPKGVWLLDMHGPDGTLYPNEWRFEEITPGRIVLRHLGPVHTFTLTVDLVPADGHTRLDWTMAFDSAEECGKVLAYAPSCNEENLNRLEAELAAMSPETADPREIVITRLIDAPRANVFAAWTDTELLKKWFTPPPYLTVHAELDVRPGGSNLIVMRGPDGVDIPNHGVYLEVVPNERLVLTDAYTRAWEPSEKPFITTILTFGDENGKTRYTARVRHWTPSDRKSHEAMGFHEGWGVATEQLAAISRQASDFPKPP